MSKQQVLDLTASSVELAARLVGEVEFSAEDALRTEPEYLAPVLELALASGSRILNVPDTVGYTTPRNPESVVTGKSVTVRVDLGGRQSIKKKTKNDKKH